MNFFTHLTRSQQSNFACCDCRISKSEEDTSVKSACPSCGHTMHNMGAGFIPPRHSDKAEWQKVAFLVKHNFTFEYLSA